MASIRTCVACALLLLATVAPPLGAQSAPPTGASNLPFWTGMSDSAAFEHAMDARLAHAQQLLTQLLAVTGTRTIANTLRPFDDVQLELDAVSSQAGLIEAVHPDAKVRETAEHVTQKVGTVNTQISLNRGVYDAIRALDVSPADAETRYYVQRTLRDFHLAGVDKDDATRKRIQELRDDLVQIGQAFDRNIREDLRTVTAKSETDLEGLPRDFITRHKPDANGNSPLTIDYPDSLPVFAYARNEDLRKRMFFEYNNRACPKNCAGLGQMMATRAELARLIGYANWADYITADKMVESARNASVFIDRIVAASGPRSKAEYQALLKRKQQDVPGATVVNAWEKTYYSELVRKASYDFDSQSVRPYLPFDRVKQGLFDVTGRLFGVTYRPVKDVPVWDPSVEAFEMLQDGRVVGRFYLDMHPRANKYNHAAEFGIRTGVAGRQLPEAALICNLPGGQPGDPGLMTHDDVVTFSTSSDTWSTRSSQAITSGSASAETIRNRTSSKRPHRCSRSGPGIRPHWRRSRNTTKRINPSRPPLSPKCVVPTNSGKRSTSGNRWCMRACRCRFTIATRPGSIRRRWSKRCNRRCCRFRSWTARIFKPRSAIWMVIRPCTTPTCGRW